MKELQIIVLGEAGSGKSTLVLWLEKQLKKKGFDVHIDLENELQDYGTEVQFRTVGAHDRKAKLKRIKAERKITLKSMQAKRGYFTETEGQIKTDNDN